MMGFSKTPGLRGRAGTLCTVLAAAVVLADAGPSNAAPSRRTRGLALGTREAAIALAFDPFNPLGTEGTSVQPSARTGIENPAGAAYTADRRGAELSGADTFAADLSAGLNSEQDSRDAVNLTARPIFRPPIRIPYRPPLRSPWRPPLV